MIGEASVPTALHHLQHRLLDEAVQHRRDTQLSYPTVWLWYFYPFHPLRFVSSAQQLLTNGWPVLLQVIWQLLDSYPIDTSTTFVALEGFQLCFAINASVPSTEPLGASLLLISVKASSSWFFCRLSLMSGAAYLLSL
jgi:hypothetical protein